VQIARQQRNCFHAVLALLGLSVVSLVGCGDGNNTTTVSGTISFNGKPITSGVINFLAQGARPQGGGINADGSYSFELPPGEYQVRIDTPQPLPEGWKEGQPLPKLPPRQVPEKYASFNSSGLKANITGNEDPQTVDFKLP
jgi:hypothetical protein